MDNGQTQTPQGQPNQPEFFTAGVGINSPEVNPDNDNIESSVFQDIQEGGSNRQATHTSLGNTALNTSPDTPDSGFLSPELIPTEVVPEASLNAMPLPQSNPTEKLGTIYDYDLNKPPIIEEDNAVQNNPVLNNKVAKSTPKAQVSEVSKEENLGELACVADGKVDKGDIVILDNYIKNVTDPDEMSNQVAAARLAANKKEVA